MKPGTYKVSFTAYWNTSKITTHTVQVHEDGSHWQVVNGRAHKTVPYNGEGYTWEAL